MTFNVKVDLIIGVFTDLIRRNLIHPNSGSIFCIPDLMTLSFVFLSLLPPIIFPCPEPSFQ
jgi:hypothetical protein